MTKSEMYTQFTELLNKCKEIMSAKNADYSGGDDGPFLNFNQIEMLTKGKITRDQGVLVRMTDKLSRVHRLLENNAVVKNETIEDTLMDLANYSLLLILLRWERQKKGQE
jgi:hypothetical protein